MRLRFCRLTILLYFAALLRVYPAWKRTRAIPGIAAVACIIATETLQESSAMIRIFRRCDFAFDGKDENMISMSLNLS